MLEECCTRMQQLLRHVSAVTEQKKKCCESLAQKFDRFQTLGNQLNETQQHATRGEL